MKNNNTIVAFAGRKESGKSEISKLFTEYGYERISFATPLKHLIATLINGTIKDVDNNKYASWHKTLHQMDLMCIAQETNIPIEIVKEKLSDVIFHNTREMLQIIGTDLIRDYNPNWHANKTVEYIENSNNNKFVIDDLRFPNEKEMVENLGGDTWFIARPYAKNVSNHSSENSLKWQDFDNVIVNDKGLEYLKLNWQIFLENGYKESMNTRLNLLHKIHGNKTMIEEIKNATQHFTVLDALFISPCEFTYEATYFQQMDNPPQIDSIINAPHNNHYVLVKKNETIKVVTHPLAIEDLKLYMNQNVDNYIERGS